MKNGKRIPRSQVEYGERFLQHVEERRGRPFTADDLQRILTELESPDELVRAKAVREACPCRVSWPVFQRLRKSVKRLQHDPSAVVRANAWHVEEDAREVLAFEGLRDRLGEGEDHREGAFGDARCRRTHPLGLP